jgi:hypothetical protein
LEVKGWNQRLPSQVYKNVLWFGFYEDWWLWWVCPLPDRKPTSLLDTTDGKKKWKKKWKMSRKRRRSQHGCSVVCDFRDHLVKGGKTFVRMS